LGCAFRRLIFIGFNIGPVIGPEARWAESATWSTGAKWKEKFTSPPIVINMGNAISTFMEVEIRRIMEDLDAIKSELRQIKETMPDKEMFLSSEEAQLLSESFENERNGKLLSSKELREELGI
jgi:hypothetical protein